MGIDRQGSAMLDDAFTTCTVIGTGACNHVNRQPVCFNKWHSPKRPPDLLPRKRLPRQPTLTAHPTKYQEHRTHQEDHLPIQR